MKNEQERVIYSADALITDIGKFFTNKRQTFFLEKKGSQEIIYSSAFDISKES